MSIRGSVSFLIFRNDTYQVSHKRATPRFFLHTLSSVLTQTYSLRKIRALALFIAGRRIRRRPARCRRQGRCSSGCRSRRASCRPGCAPRAPLLLRRELIVRLEPVLKRIASEPVKVFRVAGALSPWMAVRTSVEPNERINASPKPRSDASMRRSTGATSFCSSSLSRSRSPLSFLATMPRSFAS